MKFALIITLILWIVIIIGLQVALPIIDRAQAHYTMAERRAIAEMREQYAKTGMHAVVCAID